MLTASRSVAEETVPASKSLPGRRYIMPFRLHLWWADHPEQAVLFLHSGVTLFSTRNSRPIEPDSRRARVGGFSALCTEGFSGGICNNAAHQLFDPGSSATPATRTAFANNQIPIGRLNSLARAIVTSPFIQLGRLPTTSTSSKPIPTGDLKIDFVPSEIDQ